MFQCVHCTVWQSVKVVFMTFGIVGVLLKVCARGLMGGRGI